MFFFFICICRSIYRDCMKGAKKWIWYNIYIKYMYLTFFTLGQQPQPPVDSWATFTPVLWAFTMCAVVVVLGSVWHRGRRTAVKTHSPLLVVTDSCEGVESEKNSRVHLCHQHLQLQHSHARSFLDCLLIAEIWRKKDQNVFASSHQCIVVKTKLCCSSWGQRSVWIWYLNWKDLVMSWYGSLPL